MSSPLPTPLDCCVGPCPDTCLPLVLPGPKGDAGTNGSAGTNGKDAFTTLTAPFTMPAELATAIATVGDSSFAQVNAMMFVSGLGFFQVTATGAGTITLKNLKDTPNAAYMSNAAPGTIAPPATVVVPAGLQGPSGVLSGAAGGDLEGNYPNPTLAISNTLGQLLVNTNAAVAPRVGSLSPGPATQILHSNGAAIPSYKVIDLTGVATAIANALPLVNGGTAYAAASIADLIKHLLPLTTLGDLVCYDSLGAINRLAAGSNGFLLGADNTTATGLKWVAPPTGGTYIRQIASVSPTTVSAPTSLVGVTVLPMTVQLGLGASYGLKTITVKDELGTAGANNITILPNGVETIEGAASYVISINRGVARLYFVGGDWKIV